MARKEDRTQELSGAQEARRTAALVVRALASEAGRFASLYDRDDVNVDVGSLNRQVIDLQCAMNTALMNLNNALVEEWRVGQPRSVKAFEVRA